MKSIQMYWHPNCSTCKKAVKFLQAHNFQLNLLDLREKAPSKTALKQMMQHYTDQEKKLFNTSGQVYQENNYKEKIQSMSKQEMIEALASNGLLLKRPFVLLDNGNGAVGFKEEEYKTLFNIS